MKLSIVIPCYNEADNIAAVVNAVRNANVPSVTKEIVIVDDGSSDRSVEILKQYEGDSDITLHFSKTNSGKGMAIRIGLEYITGDIVVIQDADLEYDPSQYADLLRPIIDGEAEVVYGSRFRGSIKGMKLANRIANYILTWTANILFGAHITDEATCYKAFKAYIIKDLQLKCTRFEFCPEVTAKISKRAHKIYEIPIEYTGRGTNEGKKIRWTDAFIAMWTLIKYRFVD